MKPLFIILILASGSLRSAGEETKIWSGNKLTPEQPFPAKVRAVWAGWEGYSLLLEEIGGTQNRLCIAEVHVLVSISYGLIKDTEVELKAEPQRKTERWIYLSPQSK